MLEGIAQLEIIYDENGEAHDYRFIEINPAFCRITGFSREKLLHQRASELYQRSPPPYLKIYAQVDKTAQQQQFETYLKTQQKHVSISAFKARGATIFTVYSDITNFRQSETELRRALSTLDGEKSFFKSLIRNLPDLVWLKDPDGVYLACNAEFEKLYGATEAEILGKTDYDFVDRELAVFFRQHDQRALQQFGSLVNEEWVTYRQGNRRVLLETTKTALRDNNGQAIGVLGTGHDITERKQLQQQLQQQEVLMLEAQKLAHIGHWKLDFQNQSLEWSDETFRIYQQSPRKLQPGREEFLRLVHPEDRDVVDLAFKKSLNKRSPFHSTHRLQLGTEIKYVEERCITEFDANGKPLRSLGTTQDVSDRVKYQIQINRFNDLIDQSTDGIFIIDADSGRLLNVNQAACTSLGYNRTQALKLHMWDISERVKNAADWQAQQSKFIKLSNISFESTHVTRAGAQFPVEINARYVKEPDGNFFIATARDISERKKSEKLIFESSQRYKAVLESTKDGFWVVSRSGHLLEVNAAYIRFSGYSEDELIGMHVSEIDALEKSEGAYARRRHVEREGGAIFETEHRCKDGSHCPVEVSISHTKVKGGQFYVFIRDIRDRKQAEKQIEFMAFNDVLTGLPNRRLFADRLQKAVQNSLRSQMQLAICYIDLDGFKPINDKYGHPAGDQLLIQLSTRLQKNLRDADTLARLGGDEFVLLLSNLESPHRAEEIVQRVLDNITQPFEIEGKRLHVSASIGMTLFPSDNSDPDTLIRHADQAMYQAKEQGKNRYCLFAPVQHEQRISKLQQQKLFRQALESNQLELHYQPRIRLADAQAIAVEALIRWPQPDHSLKLPGQFLNLIKNTSHEFALDEWVLKTALKQLQLWQAQGLHLSISVNISPRHIQQPSFPAYLASLLHQYPENLAALLEFEILETSAIGNTQQVSEILLACKKLGVQVSLDDFGTGYSSLTHFHRLPIDILKLDQSFVRHMLDHDEDQKIVEGVLRLAQALDRPVVAEGVETRQLAQVLASFGCEYAQGFGIAPAMPAAEIGPWVKAFAQDPDWQKLL